MKFKELKFNPGTATEIIVAVPGPKLPNTEFPVCPVIAVNRAYEYLQLVDIEIECIATGDVGFVRNYLKSNVEPYHNFAYLGDMQNMPNWFQVHNSGIFGIYVASLYKPKKIYLIGFGGKGHYYNDAGSGFQPKLIGAIMIKLASKGIGIKIL